MEQVSGPNAEGAPLWADAEWLARFEAKMADLTEARQERARQATEGAAAWKKVEDLTDRAIGERAERAAERRQSEAGD